MSKSVRDFDEKTRKKNTLKTPKKLVVFASNSVRAYVVFYSSLRQSGKTAQKEANFCYFLHQKMRWRAKPDATLHNYYTFIFK